MHGIGNSYQPERAIYSMGREIHTNLTRAGVNVNMCLCLVPMCVLSCSYFIVSNTNPISTRTPPPHIIVTVTRHHRHKWAEQVVRRGRMAVGGGITAPLPLSKALAHVRLSI